MMDQRKKVTGGFYLPLVFQQNQKMVSEKLNAGDIDYAELSKWNFPDKFLCYVLETGLLEFVDKTYPNPRINNEVPIWFLITCQFVMRLYLTGKYHNLNYLLNAGSLLTRFGFNVGSKRIGFNDKNKKTRVTALHPDTVRKFFKDTDHIEIRQWYRNELQIWFKNKRAFDAKGIFILDQSHLVVPDNPNYKGAVRMPVDEHGQRYENLGKLSEEQKKGLPYHPCYTFSTLLNVGIDRKTFHVAGYEVGPGNEDELVQAERLVREFCEQHPGILKELIVDRGYIDAQWIQKIKRKYKVDTIIPVRKNMNVYEDAKSIAIMQDNWELIEMKENSETEVVTKTEITGVKDIATWTDEEFKVYTVVIRYSEWDGLKKISERYAVLVSTKKFSSPRILYERYRLRVLTEERFRQLKCGWHITKFPSTHESLIESHICFTLFTYSLLQLYLRKNDLKEKTSQMMQTLQSDESIGKDSVLVYAKDKYGVYDLDDYTIRVTKMQPEAQQQLAKIMENQKEVRITRGL